MNTQIRNYPNYLMTPFGVVLKKEGGFARVFARNGYNYVCLEDGHGTKMEVRHDILIAKTLIPNKERRQFVGHINGDTLNDNVSNLKWISKEI